MASLIPWKEFESEYSAGFSPEMGAPAKSFRMALNALIIKEKLGISDREPYIRPIESKVSRKLFGLLTLKFFRVRSPSFSLVVGAEPTNNAAERAICPAVSNCVNSSYN
ncbi:hypothetical protein CDG79_22735 [Nostoc sp. 'Peltigera membranacea cyanobiont' 232]|nr:hypothetical protein CDG79_22735 [Nostoc sp. 'Peltigera membranacea cyanobiont' 232]